MGIGYGKEGDYLTGSWLGAQKAGIIDTLRPEGMEILSSSSPLNTENYFPAPEEPHIFSFQASMYLSVR